MAQIIKPTSDDQSQEHMISIFLAGSIEMGVAEDWQTRLQNELSEYDVLATR